MNTSITSYSGLRVLLILACLVVIIAGLKSASAIVVPLLIALFLATLVTPLMIWLREKGIPTIVALILILIMLIGFVAIIGSLIGTSINELSGALPAYEQKLQVAQEKTIIYVGSLGIDLPTEGIGELIDPREAAQFFGGLLTSFGGILSDSLLIIFMVLFVLVEAIALPEKLRTIFPNPEKTMINFAGFMEDLKKYLGIKTAVSLLTGILVTIWLTILGVEFAILWGFVAFLLNFVPYVGSLIAAVPVVVLGILDVGLTHAILIAAGYLTVNMIVGNLLEPRFMGQGVGLSTLVVFLSLVFWGWVFGPVGMFLSVPLTMLVKIGLKHYPKSQWIAVLISAEIKKKR